MVKQHFNGERHLKRLLPPLVIALLLALIPFAALAQVYRGGDPPKTDWYSRPLLRLTVFSSGQSDCMLLECGGQAMMIDGGSEPYRDRLKAAMDERGITHFKYLLNTHYHEDHISGLYWLMRYGFQVDEYLHPYTDYAMKIVERHERTVSQARRSGVAVRQVFDGDELLLGEAVVRIHRQEDGVSTNAKSLMTRVVFGDSSVLLTADIIGKTQNYFVNALSKEELQADILKAPHHGITPMVVSFLEAVAPDMLFMTNSLSRVTTGKVQADARGIPTYYTGEGTLVLETDGDDWYVYQQMGLF